MFKAINILETTMHNKAFKIQCIYRKKLNTNEESYSFLFDETVDLDTIKILYNEIDIIDAHNKLLLETKRLTDNINQSVTKNDQLLEEIEKTKNELKHLRSNINQLRSENDNIIAEAAQLRNNTNKATSESIQLKKALDQSKHENVQLQSEYDILRGDFSEYKANATNTENAENTIIDELKKELISINAKNVELNNQLYCKHILTIIGI